MSAQARQHHQVITSLVVKSVLVSIKKCKKLLKEFGGENEIVFYDIETKKYIKASGVKISINENIISALKMILGSDAVVYKD